MEDAKDTANIGRSDQRVGFLVATFERKWEWKRTRGVSISGTSRVRGVAVTSELPRRRLFAFNGVFFAGPLSFSLRIVLLKVFVSF